MVTLVKFLDKELNEEHYGIYRPVSETIICGCCGGTFEKEDYEILDKWDAPLENIIREAMKTE